ncbi:DUF2637 domain-containing protein [Microtetraspora glauca]|uniref:DUF2637 domain-containing protein n=1 Tax=Microtetraspora glauca TaxID=1996 RepID=A0ABV3GA83_MICGL
MRDPNDGVIDAPDLIEAEAEQPRRFLSRLRPFRRERIASEKPSRSVPAPRRGRPSRGESIAVAALGVLLVGLIAVAFRGSWTAHRDAALSAHFDRAGADLYPFAPDGLIIIALIAAMVLRHSRGARFYCLTVVGIFTATSYVINHLHGLGWFAMRPGTTELVTPLPWGVVALVALQVIAAIFFGSHILVHVFRHLFPGVGHGHRHDLDSESLDSETAAEGGQERAGTAPEGDPNTNLEESEGAEPDPREVARLVYAACLEAGVELSRRKLSEVARISERQAGYIKTDVEVGGDQEPTDEELTAGMTPAETLTGPGISALRREYHAVNGTARNGSTGGDRL